MTSAAPPPGPLHVKRWGHDDVAGTGTAVDGADGTRVPRALLLHGLTSSAETMWQLGEGLAAAGWSVTAPDLPGHGASPEVPSYRVDDLAATVAPLGERWDLVVGHSLGGAVAIALLADHPGRAARAVLIDPVIAIDDTAAELVLAEYRADLAAPDAALIAAEHPSWHPRTVQARVRSTLAVRPDAVQGVVRQNRPWDLVDRAARIDVPVLVLVAERGSAVAPGVVDRIAAGNSRWSAELVPGTTHSVHRDRPDLVLDRLLGPTAA